VPYWGVGKAFISPEEAAQLRRLYAEAHEASKRAADALRTNPPGHILEGEALARFAAEEKKIGDIMRWIKEIRAG
jgi:hypothetical protein